jgi:alkylated DNA nucleotide flippase Atl1
MLGPDSADVQARLLHTLGNLTLTGYNPELSDRPFLVKRDMAGGFKDSHLQLNKGLAALEAWNEAAIAARATTLAEKAVALWKRPSLPPEKLVEYRAKFKQEQGFDWSLTHRILEELPEGKWTGYYYLAEAVGTSAQAVANHVAKCPECVRAYRVLTWDGHIADGFSWSDPNDNRDPRDVLEAEGVFFSTGVADPDTKLVVEDLLALVEDDD